MGDRRADDDGGDETAATRPQRRRVNQSARSVAAFIGLGSNLEDPRQQVETALCELAALPTTHLRRRSSLYRTPPLGPPDQPDYINAVAELTTQLAPLELLDELQRLEVTHHRVRERHWGPRTLDLDLLLYSDLTLRDPRLTLPHPRLVERLFVIVPLYEIAPDLDIPHIGALRELYQRADLVSIQRL
jgi:2-amino-4-hydroxy-6-hydroxymethyldihydropteridine diphosphokinase